MPRLKERVKMFIKYCESCQRVNTWKMEKCPHEMKPIKVTKFGLKLVCNLAI